MEEDFVKLINQNQGILQRICNIYFYQHPYREDYYQELYRVALNAAIDLVRKESILPVCKGLSAQEDSICDSCLEENYVVDERERLYQAINQLPDVEKAIIILYLEGYEYKEISAIIGISDTNVGVKINRIKKQLIKRIQNGRQ